jgi:hypothetical protein
MRRLTGEAICLQRARLDPELRFRQDRRRNGDTDMTSEDMESAEATLNEIAREAFRRFPQDPKGRHSAVWDMVCRNPDLLAVLFDRYRYPAIDAMIARVRPSAERNTGAPVTSQANAEEQAADAHALFLLGAEARTATARRSLDTLTARQSPRRKH